MSKGKSITLLSIISVIIALVLVMSFIRFPVGIYNYNSLLGAVNLDYDLEGGTAYTLTLSEDNEDEVDDIDSVIDTLEYRLGQLGYGTYSVKALKSTEEGVEDYSIRIETKTTDTLSQDIQVVIAYGELKFFGGASAEEATTEILQDIEVVESATYKGEVTAGAFEIDIKFTQKAYDELAKLIDEAELDYYLKITLGEAEDGTEKVLFQDKIETSYFKQRQMPLYSDNAASARQLALQMQNDGLAYRYDIDNGVSVSSPYGEDAALKCAVAIITLSVLLMVLLIVVYKGYGIVGALSSLLFILCEGWLLIGIPNVLINLGGVIGIMLATILNFISIIILLDRIKCEFNLGQKTVKASINKGFAEAVKPTIVLNVVAGVVALALFAFTQGLIQSFAITFGIGAVLSIISGLAFTRMFSSLIMPLVKDKEKFIGVKADNTAKALVKEEA